MKININIHSKGNTMAKPTSHECIGSGDRRPILHQENWYNFLAEDKAV